jgi:hypothetical protein
MQGERLINPSPKPRRSSAQQPQLLSFSFWRSLRGNPSALQEFGKGISQMRLTLLCKLRPGGPLVRAFSFRAKPNLDQCRIGLSAAY